jgi:predicted DNA-binding antitoxin AbrB/MazE fold protein
MTIQIDAVYEGGVLRPTEPLSLPDGAEVRIVIDTRTKVDDPLASVIGIGDGPQAGDVADRHDDYLYGKQSD